MIRYCEAIKGLLQSGQFPEEDAKRICINTEIIRADGGNLRGHVPTAPGIARKPICTVR